MKNLLSKLLPGLVIIVKSVFSKAKNRTDLFFDAILQDNSLAAWVLLTIFRVNPNSRVKGFPALHVAVLNGNKEIVKILLNKKADRMAKDYLGNSVLHTAVLGGHLEMIEILRNRKESIKAQRVKSKGSYLFAPTTEERKEVIKILLTRGADLALPNANGDPVLHAAVRADIDRQSRSDAENNIVEMLMGAIVKIKGTSGLDLQNKIGDTAFYVATSNSHITSQILELGANINIKNGEDCTPLEKAHSLRQFDITYKIAKVEQESIPFVDISLDSSVRLPSTESPASLLQQGAGEKVDAGHGNRVLSRG